jgi:hypothetical protein
MAYSPQLYPRQRAPRVKLGGAVLALIQLENQRQVRAKLHQLSINGGLLQLTEPLEEQVPVEVLFCLRSNTVRARAETIFPMWATHGYLQPFRFTDLREEDRRGLEADLKVLLSGAPLGLQSLPGTDGDLAALTVPAVPTEVVVYFDHPEDAFRFTVAISSVISNENQACTRQDLIKLAHEVVKVSRVTTKGILKPSRFGEAEEIELAPAPDPEACD